MKPEEKSSRRPAAPVYGVITADLVESRRIENRAGAQERLSQLVRLLNRKFLRSLGAPFMVTLGDEIQGLFTELEGISGAVITIHEMFHPRHITVGIGVGTIATRLVRKVTEMDGLAFTHSRTALDVAKKRGFEIAVRTGNDEADGVLNALYWLVGGIQSGWNETQWKRVNLYRRFGTIEKVAKELGVARQSVGKSLRNTLWLRVQEVEVLLPKIFASLRGRA